MVHVGEKKNGVRAQGPPFHVAQVFMLSINRVIALSSVLPGFHVSTVLCYHGNSSVFFFKRTHFSHLDFHLIMQL